MNGMKRIFENKKRYFQHEKGISTLLHCAIRSEIDSHNFGDFVFLLSMIHPFELELSKSRTPEKTSFHRPLVGLDLDKSTPLFFILFYPISERFYVK